MAVSIANDLCLQLSGSGTVTTHIQELSTSMSSKAAFDVTAHQMSVGTVTARVQGSNDRVNWHNLTMPSPGDIVLMAVGRGTRSGILVEGWAYVRAEYEFTHSGMAAVVLTSSLATGE
jgi:hypothetical protein